MASQKRETLGTNVIPINYRIDLEISLKTFKFSADETISLEVKDPQNFITLNSQALTITSASISTGGKNYLAKISHDEKKERTEFKIEKTFSGKAELSLHFESEIKENANRGLYRSKYKNGKKEGYILTTQFEPSDARCAFPCFDEPGLKATYDLSLTIDRSLSAVSNTTIKSETEVPGNKKHITFNTTPRMSTYLVYLGVGPFEFTESKMGNLLIRVVTAPGRSGQAEMAIGFAKSFVKFYEDYFDIKYPLPKLDLIAIPDFTAGASAMENWGAITFRQAELLGIEEDVSFTMRRRICTVVSHEIAHQWFGDLVTMAWWDDLWLNESFATFMEKKTLEALYPHFKRALDAATGETSAAFGDDAQLSTHPINVTVNSPAEVGAIFDLISYYKGSAVLAMLEDYATAEVFRMGLHRYFKSHMYSNATKDDLWDAMRQVGRGDVKDFPSVSSFWIDTAGHPMVSVSATKEGYELSQSRFTFLPFKGKERQWPIPIRYFDGKTEHFLLMKDRTAKIKTPGEFLKLNFRQKGFYRVVYDKESLTRLGKAIKAGKLSDLDTYGVISDIASSSRACKKKVTEVMNFIEEYCMGSGYPSNASISSYMSGLKIRFKGNKAIFPRARAIAMKVNRSILKSVGWAPQKGENSIITLQRSSAIRNSGICEDPEILPKCRELFEAHASGKSQMPVDIRTAVYLAISFNGDEKLSDKFIGMYKNSDGGEEQIRLGAAIGSFNDAKLAFKALEFTMSKEVRTQDKNGISAFVSSMPNGKDVFREWLKKNWQEIKKLYNGDISGLSRFIEDLDDIDSEADMEDIKAFFGKKSNYVPGMEKVMKETLESIEISIRFVKYNS